MKKLNKILICALFLALANCDDIIEEDISNDLVETISPIEGQIIEGNVVQFSWQELDGTDDYRIQIMNELQQFQVDSTISGTYFNYNLNPGAYQWRIKGKNFAYESEYTFPLNFTVEASDDLTNQVVVLTSPSEDYYTNNPGFVFTWSSLFYADTYTFTLIKNLNGQETIFQETNITSTSLSLDASIFNEDAEYIWQVKAFNTNSETQNSSRSIFLDQIAPNQPTLSSPQDLETLSDLTVTFNWVNGTDTGNIQSSISNLIEISTDSSFGTILHSNTVSSNSYQYELSDNGNYYWRVKALDLAGNESDYSAIRTFTLQ